MSTTNDQKIMDYKKMYENALKDRRAVETYLFQVEEELKESKDKVKSLELARESGECETEDCHKPSTGTLCYGSLCMSFCEEHYKIESEEIDSSDDDFEVVKKGYVKYDSKIHPDVDSDDESTHCDQCGVYNPYECFDICNCCEIPLCHDCKTCLESVTRGLLFYCKEHRLQCDFCGEDKTGGDAYYECACNHCDKMMCESCNTKKDNINVCPKHWGDSNYDSDDEECNICGRVTDQITPPCSVCEAIMCDKCGHFQHGYDPEEDPDDEDAPWYCPQHFLENLLNS